MSHPEHLSIPERQPVWLARVYESITQERRGLIALSLVRIGYGMLVMTFLLLHLPVRDQLWGVNSVYSWDYFRSSAEVNQTYSLYLLSNSALLADILYAGLFVAAALFALGWRTRVVAPTFFVLLWSMHERNPSALNGGDNLMRIILLYMCFAQVNAYFSLDRRRALRRGAGPWMPSKRDGGTRHRVATVLHNGALLACVFQLSVVYMAAGLFKVQGEMWQEGTALYYVLRVAEYAPWPELSRLIYESTALVVLGTYATVFLQVLFPVLLLNRVTRHISMIALMGMHVGIGVLMALPFFSLFMMVTDLLVFSDRDLLSVRRYIANRRRGRSGTPEVSISMSDRPTADTPDTPGPSAAAEPVAVSYGASRAGAEL